MIRTARQMVSLVSLVSLLPVLALACGGTSTNDDSGSEESALRALAANEIVGSIAPGQTLNVSYSSTPQYRAFKIDVATADTTLDLLVHSTDGNDPKAWLLGSTFATLTSNDNASPSTRDAHIVHKVAKAGTYYLALREVTGKTSSMTVAYAGAPGPSSDPFDPGSCLGAPMTAAEALSHLDLPNGVQQKQIGRFRVLVRTRACYPNVSCSPWQAGGSDLTAPFAPVNQTLSSATTNNDLFRILLDGDVLASYKNNAPQIVLQGDNFHAGWGASFTQDFLDSHLAPAPLTPGSTTASSVVAQAWNWQPSLGCPNGQCQGNDSVLGSSPVSFAARPLTVSGTLSSSCLRLAAAPPVEARTDTNGNHFSLESQLVVTATFSASTCKVKTCQDQDKDCGTVSDGCGGTLDCGGCSGVNTCGGGGPANVCGNMLPCGGACTGGQVCCPGVSGCYDACF